MNKHLIALATAAILAGCGGGSDEAASSHTSTPAAAVAQLRTALSAQVKVAAAPTPEQAAEQLLDYAETTFPGFFPTHQATATLDPFRFRYYPQTGIYVGVVVKPNMGYTMDGVYVMGGVFGDAPIYVGQLTAFITPHEPGTGGPTGPNNNCFDLTLMETTGTRIDITYQHTGEAVGTVSHVWTINGAKTFEGHAAIESQVKMTGTLTSDGETAPVDSDFKEYSKRTGDFEVTGYGGDSVIRTSIGGFDVTFTSKGVDNPPSLDRRYGLGVGQSVTQSSTTTTTSSTVGIPGVPSTPSTSTSTSTETIKFVAREPLTVGGKTYSTCRFDTTSAATPNIVNSMWVIDGKGIPVQLRTTSGAAVTSMQQATVVKLNGQNL